MRVKKFRIKIFIFFVLLIFFFLLNTSFCANITSSALRRIIFIKYKDNCGTAFTTEVNNKQYIITAKHILKGINHIDEIYIFYQNEWKKMKVKSIQFKDREVDAIVLEPNIQLTPKTNIEFSMDNLVLGQDVYLLGFPFGLKTDVGTVNNDFPIPFVKKGVCSSIDASNYEEKIIWIDGYSNPGFSGGPIVFRDIETEKLKIAGVIKGHLNENVNIMDENGKTGLYAKVNSGLIYGIGIDSIIKLIQTNEES